MIRIGNLLIAALALCAGCATSVKTTYSPVSLPIYTQRIGSSVAVGKVADSRDIEATGYYKSFQMWDKANYEKPVSEVVREALTTELKRAGATVQDLVGTASTESIAVDTEVLEYIAEVTRPKGLFPSDVLDLKVRMRFRWTDSTGKVLEENERSECTTRKLGVGKGPVLPYAGAEVRGYGEELMNSILPRVIEKEIRLTKVFN